MANSYLESDVLGILHVLRQAYPNPVSSNAIAKALSISVSRVAKAIDSMTPHVPIYEGVVKYNRDGRPQSLEFGLLVLPKRSDEEIVREMVASLHET